ncbi:phage holin [Escherichia coli]|nr:phage holin [Escherichia coli]
MANNLPGLLNVALCSFIVPTLFFYRRRDSRHKPLVSLLAWLLMTVSGHGYRRVYRPTNH